MLRLEMFVSDEAMELYGPYIRSDRDDFSHGVENPAGRALINATVRVIEIAHEGNDDREFSVDDWLAGYVVSTALARGHLGEGDLGFDPGNI